MWYTINKEKSYLFHKNQGESFLLQKHYVIIPDIMQQIKIKNTLLSSYGFLLISSVTSIFFLSSTHIIFKINIHIQNNHISLPF